MARRTYDHYCGLAHALDLLGERWTLLVLRELLVGPRRFSDVLAGMPGVSTGLLSDRLRTLEDAGLVLRRRLPAPAASTVYELTAAGRELEPVLLGLTRFGLQRLGPPAEHEAFSPRWAMVAMRARLDPAAARGVHATYEFVVGEETFAVQVADGAVDFRDGAADAPVVRVTAQPDAFAAALDPERAAQALSEGTLAIDGDPRDVRTCLAILAPHPPHDSPPASA